MSKKHSRNYKPKLKLYKSLKTTIYNRNLNKKHIVKLDKYLEEKDFNYYYYIDKNLKFKIKLFDITFLDSIFPYDFSLKYTYKNNLKTKQKLCFFYNNLSFKYLKKYYTIVQNKTKKKILTNRYNKNWFFKTFLEQRIDSIFYRSYFVSNFKEIKLMVKKNAITVNNIIIKNWKTLIKKGDILNISKFFHEPIKKNIIDSLKFDFLPKNFQINFNILKIIYLNKNLTCHYDINTNLNYYTKCIYNINLINRYFQYR